MSDNINSVSKSNIIRLDKSIKKLKANRDIMEFRDKEKDDVGRINYKIKELSRIKSKIELDVTDIVLDKSELMKDKKKVRNIFNIFKNRQPYVGTYSDKALREFKHCFILCFNKIYSFERNKYIELQLLIKKGSKLEEEPLNYEYKLEHVMWEWFLRDSIVQLHNHHLITKKIMKMSEDELKSLYAMMFGLPKEIDLSVVRMYNRSYAKTEDPFKYPPMLLKCKNNGYLRDLLMMGKDLEENFAD
mmetsp:Transcript_54844/g.46218  ORF Transcript_54844/g.46218 Transcript_54844/m.46218 type:complete len:245 (+) Transcript_54844:124-858(+)